MYKFRVLLMLSPFLTLLCFSSQPKQECTSADDCSLNGDCVVGRCHCDVGWAGSACDVLNVQPVDRRRSGYYNATAASWGGNTLLVNGTFHLFVAQMTRHCGLEHWGSNSAIVRAESTSPNGPFVYSEIVLAPEAHNPTVRLLPAASGGGVVIFFIGSPQVPFNCSAGHEGHPQPDLRAHYNSRKLTPNNGAIHAIHAPTIFGPWSKPVQISFDDEDNPTSGWIGGGYNPSPHIMPDNSVLLAVQRGLRSYPGKEFIGVARSATWRGPYKMITKSPIVPQHWGCVAGTGEDPFLWADRRGKLHMIYHGMCPSGLFQAHHAFSHTGDNWTVSRKQPYSYTIRFSDGTKETFARVERPQLGFDLVGDAVVLYNGVCHGSTAAEIYECLELKPPPGSNMSFVVTQTWTLARPLR